MAERLKYDHEFFQITSSYQSLNMEEHEHNLFEAGEIPQKVRKKHAKHPKLVYDGFTYHFEKFLGDNATSNYR